MVDKNKKVVKKNKVVKKKVRLQDRISGSAGVNKARKAQAAKRKALAAKKVAKENFNRTRKAADAKSKKSKKQVATNARKNTKNTPKKTSKFKEGVKRLGKVAGKTLRSPVGKFGPLGAAVTGAYFLGEEFFPNKKKKPVVKKPVAKKKAPIKKRKLSPGESKIRKSDIMGGSKGRLSGPQGPLGGKLDKRKKSTVVKNRNKRFNPKKANRAGQKFGQR
tara:strand:- start:7 stop:663 length:657 start_codon:yes stop_codon:yes gene_type:complete